MSHGVYCCASCMEILIQCRCMGPHHKIPNGLCKDCRAAGKSAMPKAFLDIERLANFLMLNFQSQIVGGEAPVDMAMRLLALQKAGPTRQDNSVPAHERMSGRPAAGVR